MILARAPLRISIGGGGTDMPAYYKLGGTIFSSMAINQYVYVASNIRFFNKILIRYSKNELVSSVNGVEHPIIRKTLEKYLPNCSDLELTTIADVPSGTGLGSSGSFGVALQIVLRVLTEKNISKQILAEESTQIEMVELGRPIGLQDQYIASYGGLTEFTVNEEGKVTVDRKDILQDVRDLIANNLILIYVGSIRDSGILLSKQQKDMIEAKSSNDRVFDDIVKMGRDTMNYLVNGDLKSYAGLMHEYWLIKRERQKDQTPKSIDDLYNYLFQKNLIYGGKLVGAGGGGFLLIATNDRPNILNFLKSKKLKHLDFLLDEEGAKLLSK